ncbi:MAG: sensor domain-containing diguanylate cyclase [bacterium]
MGNILFFSESEILYRDLKTALPQLNICFNSDPKELLKIIKKKNIQLIIIDMLNVENYDQSLIDLIRSKYIYKLLPLILILPLNYSLSDFEQWMLKCNDWIKYPLYIQELKAKILNQFKMLEINLNLKSKLYRADLINSVTRILNSTLDIDEVLNKIVELTVDLTSAYSGSIFLLDQEGNITHQVLSKQYVSQDIQNQILKKIMSYGLAGWVYKSQEPALVNDTRKDIRWLDVKKHDNSVNVSGINKSKKEIRSAICMPIIRRNIVLGIFTLHHTSPEHFTDDDLDLLKQITDQSSLSIENARLFGQVQQMAITDYLTGLYNRRLFFTLAEQEFFKSKRFQEPLSLLIMDIDHFKQVNDNYGHDCGDQVLQVVSRLMKKLIRRSDVLARYGGEEFIILMPKTELSGAYKLAERIRVQIENYEMKDKSKGSFNITVSLGVACADGHVESLPYLVTNADQALYRAKKKGRNNTEKFQTLEKQ